MVQPDQQPGTDEETLRLISVKECFIPLDFNEELPLYFLDIGKFILVLFGQWFSDPHTLIASKEMFTGWSDQTFFTQVFSLDFNKKSGKVSKLEIKDTGFIQAQRLHYPIKLRRLSECELIQKHSEDIIQNLRNAGLIF
jgi:hypothetical protein